MGWLAGWSKRTQLTVDHTKISANIVGLPVRVRFTSTAHPEFFSELTGNTDALKVAVTTSDGVTQTYVACHCFDASVGVAVYEFLAPTVSSTVDDVFYFYYDKTRAPNTTRNPGIYESFTGTDNAPANFQNWMDWNYSTYAPYIYSNKLKFPDASVHREVMSRFLISGPFAVSTQVNATTAPATNSWSLGIQLLTRSRTWNPITNSNDPALFELNLTRDGSGTRRVRASRRIFNSWTDIAVTGTTTETFAELKITHSGGWFDFWYRLGTGGSWTWLGNYEFGYNEEYTVSLTRGIWDSNPTAGGTHDEVKIQAGNITGFVGWAGSFPAAQVMPQWMCNNWVYTNMVPLGGYSIDSTNLGHHISSDAARGWIIGSVNGPTWNIINTSDISPPVMEFDGTNDYLETYIERYSTVGTVEVVFKADSVTNKILCGRRSPSGSATDSTNEMQLIINSSSKLELDAWDSSNNVILQVIGSTTLQTGTWYHAVGVWRGANNTGYIWLNGVQDGSASQSNAAIRDGTSTIKFGVRTASDDTRYFDGKMSVALCTSVAYDVTYAKARYHSIFDSLLTYSATQYWRRLLYWDGSGGTLKQAKTLSDLNIGL